MPTTETLEEIAQTLSNAFESNSLTHPTSPRKHTSQQLALHVATMRDRIDATIQRYHDITERVTNVSQDEIDDLPTSAQTIADHAQTLETSEAVVAHLRDRIREYEEAYSQRLKRAHGLQSSSDLIDEKFKVRSEIRSINPWIAWCKQLLGDSREHERLQDLRQRLDNLRTVQEVTRHRTIPRLQVETKRDAHEAIGNAIDAHVKEILQHYKTKHETLHATPSLQNDTIIQSLVDDYTSQITDEIRKRGPKILAHDHRTYTDEEQATLLDHAVQLVEHGVSLDFTPRTDSEQAHAIYEETDQLQPPELQDLVKDALPLQQEPLPQQFAHILGYMEDYPQLAERLALIDSIQTTTDHLFPNHHWPRRTRNQFKHRKREFDTLLDALEPEGLDTFATEIDLNLLEIIRDNDHVHERLGQDTIASFYTGVGNHLLDQSLTTHATQVPNDFEDVLDRTFHFNHSRAVAYNLLNTMRIWDSGIRGNYLKRAKTYVHTVPDENLDNLPGINDAVQVIRDHPRAYRAFDDQSENHAFRAFNDALVDLCTHYLTNGSNDERYAALDATHRVTKRLNQAGQQRRIDDVVNAITTAYDLNPAAEEYFSQHPLVFHSLLKKLGKTRLRNPHTTPKRSKKVRTVIHEVATYYTQLEDLVNQADHPQAVSDEGNDPRDFDNLTQLSDLPTLIDYLQAFDARYVQDRLNDEQHGTRFQTRLETVKKNIFSNNPEDINTYLTKDFRQLQHVIKDTDGIIDDAAHPDVIEEQRDATLDRVLTDDDITQATQWIPAYLTALNHEETTSRFETFDTRRQRLISQFARDAYGTNTELTTPLVRNVVQKEQSRHKLQLLKDGLSLLDNNMQNHLASLLNQQPNKGYRLFNQLSLAKPLLDDEFYTTINDLFPSTTSHNTLDDLPDRAFQDETTYAYLAARALQGKPVTEDHVEKITTLQKQKQRYERKVEKHGHDVHKEQLAKRNQRITRLVDDARTRAIRSEIYNAVSRSLDDIVNEPVQVDEITEDLHNATQMYHQIEKNQDVLAQIIENEVGSRAHIYNEPSNRDFLDNLRRNGIQTDVWLDGYRRTYTPQRVHDVQAKKEKKIHERVEEALTIYQDHDMDVDEDDIFDQFETFAQRDDTAPNAINDLETQLHAIKSLKNDAYESYTDDVTVYLETDPIKILQMGNVVHDSCLARGRGNTYAAVANASDVNKHVVYAEMGGEIVGRKLIGFNKNGELLQYKTYETRLDLNIDTLLQRYVNELASELNAPLEDTGEVPTLVADHWYDDGVITPSINDSTTVKRQTTPRQTAPTPPHPHLKTTGTID